MAIRNLKVIDEGKQKRLVFQASIFGRLIPSTFLIVWLTIWSAGCATMLGLLIVDFSWFFLLFCVPFFAGWFAGATALAYSLFGKRQIIIGTHTIEFINSILVTIQRRQIPFKELTGLSKLRDDEGQSSLLLHTIGKPITVANNQRAQELNAIAEILRSEIPTLRESKSAPADSQEVLQPRKKQPSECEWELESELGDQTVFSNLGQFQFGTLFSLLFINLFWNGIVSVFLAAPFAQFGGDEVQAGMFVFIYIFMIPFVLIGIVMFYALSIQILEPFRKTTWRFSDREISRTVTYLGVPFHKSWSVVLNIQMKMTNTVDDAVTPTKKVASSMDSHPKPKQKSFSIKNIGHRANSLYGIEFKEKEHVIATWKNLTKGDADWITTKLEKEQGTYSVG